MAAILVSGARGFLGQAVCEALLAAGERVVAHDRKPPSAEGVDHAGRLHPVTGDLADRAQLAELVSNHDCEGIIHTAWCWSGPLDADNEIGYRNVIGICLEKGLRRCILTGTAGIYGDTPGLITEEMDLVCKAPHRLYIAQKVQLHVTVEQLFARYPGVFASLVPGGPVYGPEMRGSYENRWPLFEAAQAAATGEPFILAQGGDQTAEYTHVDDVARGMVLAYRAKSLRHAAYHVSTAARISTRAIVETLQDLRPSFRAEVSGGLAAPGEAPDGHLRGALSYARAETEFGYAPQIDLRSGLESVLEWLEGSLRRKEPADTTSTLSHNHGVDH